MPRSRCLLNQDIRTVARFAAATRLISLLSQAVLNAVIPDHDAEAFRPPRTETPLVLDPIIEALFGGLTHWDAEHFIFIAERGYIFEHNFAFFPLYPLVLRLLSAVACWPLCCVLTLRGRLLLAVALGNSFIFVLSAVALYKLGCLVLQDRKLALIAAELYCITPAGVFMVAGYSETLFAAFTFAGLWLLESRSTCGGSALLCLAAATRANGLVNAGFLLYLSLQRRLAAALGENTAGGGRSRRLVREFFVYLITGAACTSLIALPFCFFQFYGFQTFCHTTGAPDLPPMLLDWATEKGYRMPDAASVPSWCHWRVPLLYSYVQDVYWDVGFLRYFQLKQIPNFVLALPVALLGFMASYTYVLENPEFCLYLGLKRRDGKANGFCNPRVFLYVVHSSVLLVFGVFCMHVQVLTRFLASSSPVIYWIAGHMLFKFEPLLQNENKLNNDRLTQERAGSRLWALSWMKQNNQVVCLLAHWRSCSCCTQCIVGYFLSYWFLGLAVHCNFYPWT